MPLPNTIGMSVHCGSCSRKFSLGALNARLLDHIEGAEFNGMDDIGWLCRCDHCGREMTYKRAAFIAD